MSDDRFDELTKAAASTTSRRQALKLVGGGLLAALFGGGLFASRSEGAGNGCLSVGMFCKVNGDCCSVEGPDGSLNTCCCGFDKKSETPGTCMTKEACIAGGGVCNH